ncbi:MAG: HAMP domain-containing histidine kinase [Deltaproteobacteria bacterium]|nr:HAMP domain-containing histidine kinase [Deltaproteobacteria bacterium]
MNKNPVSAQLRSGIDDITEQWESAVRERLPVLNQLEHKALVDHLPEFVFGLAAWVEGNEEEARRGFEALAQGHAVQRLGLDVDLQTLSAEYQILRNVILRHLLSVESSSDVRGALIRVNEGIDYAVHEAVHRFSARRDQIRERFVGILGHDLRSPVNAVSLAAAQITAHPCTEQRHARMAATIQRSSDRMMRMIADVIDFANAHLGQGIPAVPSLGDLGEACEEAVAELRLNFPDRNVRVERSGDLRAHFDRDRVIQALSNLISNAIQHGQDPIVVQVSEKPDKLGVLTQVKNAGPPIEPAVVNRLFDPFRAGHEGAARSRSNLGLGLVHRPADRAGSRCALRRAIGRDGDRVRDPLAACPDRDDAEPRLIRSSRNPGSRTSRTGSAHAPAASSCCRSDTSTRGHRFRAASARNRC